MAEVVNWGSKGRSGQIQHTTIAIIPASPAASPARKSIVHNVRSPSPHRSDNATPAFAMSSPSKHSPKHEMVRFSAESPAALAMLDGAKTTSQRPQSAPPLRNTGPVSIGPDPPAARQFGKLSLFDAPEKGEAHAYQGPKVLRDWTPSKLGPPPRTPDKFLRKHEGADLRARTNLAHWLKRHPKYGREPPFRPGNAGVRLTWESAPGPATIFRYLYDNSTIDFVSVRWGTMGNELVWGRRVRAGRKYWDPSPSEVEVAKWLPIFLEGIREYDEPYRFIAIRGSEALMREAGAQLHQCAADCVPPLRKALESREPTAVAVALELMVLALRLDTLVAGVWIYHLWQWAQVLRLFIQRAYRVDLGYNSREVASVRQLCMDILHLLEEQGGEHAVPLIRRYLPSVGPTASAGALARQAARAEQKAREAGKDPGWKPFTLF